MKNVYVIAAIGALSVLAGCSKGADAPADGPVKREAGNWKTDVKLVKFEMPGLPANMKDEMAKQFAASGGTEQCLTQEQAEKEDPADTLTKGMGQGCNWSKKDIGGGKIDVAGSCTANGQKVDLAMAGTMGAKKTDVTISTKGPTPAGGQMEMEMQVTSTLTGPCAGGVQS